jgi:hypothetical protein
MRRLPVLVLIVLVLWVVSLPARRALPATDTFDGTAAGLSASWTVIDGGWERVTGAALGTGEAQGNLALWNADTFANDQYAQVKVSTLGGWIAGPAVRLASLRGYIITVEAAQSQIKIQRINSDESYTSLQTIGSLTITSGDLWRLEAEGTTLRAYQNGVQRGTNQTDATYSSGAAGMFTYGAGAVALDDWEGGNLAGGDPPGAKPTCLRSLLGVGRC